MTDGRYKLYAERRCRMCQRSEDVRPLTRHHLVPLWWFRDKYCGGFMRSLTPTLWARANVNANIVPLCRPCHDTIDMGPWRDRLRARAMLRRLLTPGELSHAHRTIGARWFDRNYPSRESNGADLSPDVERRESSWRVLSPAETD